MMYNGAMLVHNYIFNKLFYNLIVICQIYSPYIYVYIYLIHLTTVYTTYCQVFFSLNKISVNNLPHIY